MAESRVLPGSAPQAGYTLGGASRGSGTWASWVTKRSPGSPLGGHLRQALPVWRGPGTRGNPHQYHALLERASQARPSSPGGEGEGTSEFLGVVERVLSSYWAEPRSEAVLSGAGRDSLLGQLD